jgi:hypothetical protein
MAKTSLAMSKDYDLDAREEWNEKQRVSILTALTLQHSLRY